MSSEVTNESVNNVSAEEFHELLDLSGDVVTVEKSHIGALTRTSYVNTLIQLTMHLYDSQPLKIRDDFRRNMTTEDGKDKTFPIESSKRKKRVHLAKLCRDALNDMSRTADGLTSPIKLRGNDPLSYSDIAGFMSTKKRKVTVNSSLARRSSQVTTAQRLPTEQSDGNEMISAFVRCSDATYQHITSSVSFLYKESNNKMPEDLKENLSRYNKGSKRLGRRLKQNLALKLTEGKSPMSKEVYSMLAKILFKSEKTEHLFAHVFLVLDWNLMKRAENCVDAKITHIYFENDSLCFEFAKSKGHQDGEEHLGPWHVYANFTEPHLCPVLALARYLFCFPEVMKSNASLFQGSHQYRRYCDILLKVVHDNRDEIKSLGMCPYSIGTHSVRKGVATMVASGCTVSPPLVSLCLRAGWVLGGVLMRYLKYEAAGDQYVGRCAACLNQLIPEFAASPPYFDFMGIQDAIQRVAKKLSIKNWIKERIPGNDIDAKTLHLAYMCFASICYHHDYITENISAGHPLSGSSFFKDIPEDILTLATVRFSREKQCWIERRNEWTIDKVNTLWNKVGQTLLERCRDKTRLNEKSWKTVYNNVCKGVV